MEHNMIKAYDRNNEKLYGEFQALKNQSVHTNAYRDDKLKGICGYLYTEAQRKFWEFNMDVVTAHRNSNLKTLLSIGGWNLGTQKYVVMTWGSLLSPR